MKVIFNLLNFLIILVVQFSFTQQSITLVLRDVLSEKPVSSALVKVNGKPVAVSDSGGNVVLNLSCNVCRIEVIHSAYAYYVDTVRPPFPSTLEVYLLPRARKLPEVEVIAPRFNRSSLQGEGLPGSLSEDVARVPTVHFSRLTGWDTRLSVEGIDSRRLYVTLEGAPMYTICPMEMGGCLAGLSSALANNVELTTDLTHSGFAQLSVNSFSIPSGATPGFALSVFSQLNSASMGYEVGSRFVYYRNRWGAGALITYARHGDYYTARGKLENTGFNQLNAIVKQVIKPAKNMSIEYGGLTVQIWDAGYPTLPVKLVKENRSIAFLKYSFYGKRFSVRSNLTYQMGMHLMQMPMRMDSSLIDMLSGAKSSIGNMEIELNYKTGERSRLLGTLYGEQWIMDAFIRRADLPETANKPQVNNGIRRELRATAGLRTMIVPNLLIAQLQSGLGVARWKAEGHTGRTVLLPLLQFLIYAYDGNNWTLAFTTGYNYRLPILVELYREQVVVNGRYLLVSAGDSLEPEQAITGRLSFTRKLLNNMAFVSLKLFSRYITNYIALQVDTTVKPAVSGLTGIARYVNIASVIVSGASAQAGIHMNRLQADLSATYTYGQIVGGDPAPYIPPLTLRATLRYNLPFNVTVITEIEHQFSQNRYNPKFGEVATQAWTLLNAGLSLKYEWGQVSLMGKNLLNQYYRHHLNPVNVFEPGRHVELKVALNLDRIISRQQTATLVISVPMRCERCKESVIRTLNEMEGVKNIEVNLDRKEVRVRVIPVKAYPDKIINRLREVMGEATILRVE